MYNALAHDSYVGGGDISATRLIAPPRIVALRRKHEDEIEEEAADRIWSLLGQSTHVILERAAMGEASIISEQRLFMPIAGLAKPDGPWVWRVSAQMDLYTKVRQHLDDYKITSVWSVLFGDKPEWERQMNIQAMIHRHNGDKVESADIVAIMRDWQVQKSKHEKGYPQQAVKKISMPLWPQAQAIEYAMERVRLHQQAQMDYEASGDPDSLPLCTPEERWYRGHKYAVKKMDKNGKVNKKADRLFDAMPQALKFMADNQATLPKGKFWAEVEERPGENKRCLDYCDVWMFCPFGKKIREEQNRRVEAIWKDADTEASQQDLFGGDGEGSEPSE